MNNANKDSQINRKIKPFICRYLHIGPFFIRELTVFDLNCQKNEAFLNINAKKDQFTKVNFDLCIRFKSQANNNSFFTRKSGF